MPSPTPKARKSQKKASSSASATGSTTQAPPASRTALELLDDLERLYKSWKPSYHCKTNDLDFKDLTDRLRVQIILETAVRSGAGADNGDATTTDKNPVTSHCAPDSCLPFANKLNALTEQAIRTITDQVSSIVKTALDGRPAPAFNPPAPIPPPRPRQPRESQDLDVVISLARVDRHSPVRAIPYAELKSRVEAALVKSGVPGLAGSTVQGVRRTANGGIAVRANDDAQAQLLLREADAWVKHYEEGAAIHRRTYMVMASAVPTSFDPSGPHARRAIYEANQACIPSPTSVLSVRWLHNRHPDRVAKSASTLVIAVAERATAEALVKRHLNVSGTCCLTAYYVPPVLQCFYCQGFGHVAKACPYLSDPARLKCARCAGNHMIKDCHCPEKTKCTDPRTCVHIRSRCANCGGNHKSLSNACPVKARAQQEFAARRGHGHPVDHVLPHVGARQP